MFIRELEHLRIPYEHVQSATKNFTTLIGRGGYGPVYKGQLTLSGKLTIVAVKRLQTDLGQGIKEFLTEIQLLSRYKHQNLVSLVGFCEEHKEKFLIYEYAEHGSLDKYLKPFKTKCPLTWKQRVNICVDAARGLDHLHNHVAQNQRVIHRDIKSGNILLDNNWKAMIADFGLSKIGRANENDTYLITNPSGTYGYCDPEYIHTGILTKESDVYSFGVVLFEVLCGRVCIINVNSKERFLVPLVQRYYEQGTLNLIVDSDLKNYMNSDSMKVFSEIAFQCLQYDREQRPSMGLVLEKLEKVLKLIEMKEAPEVLELEEILGLQKLVETLQMQEAHELQEHLQELEEILGLQKLVETCQMQEARELQNLVETLESEIGESRIDYDVIKAIYYMPDAPLSYVARDKMYSHLSSGILVDEGKVWFSLDDDGKTQELISAIKFQLPPLDRDCSTRSVPQSRFSKIENISVFSILPMQVKIRTQFLSSDVTYAVYLVCKPYYLGFRMEDVDIVYALSNRSELYVSNSYKTDHNGWWMFELFQTISSKRSADFKISFHEINEKTKFESISSPYVIGGSYPNRVLLVEGIQFQPVLKFEDEDEIEMPDLPRFSTSNIEWDKLLPDDYKQYLYYSNNEMMKMPQSDVIFPTKEEAYSILSEGVLINFNHDKKMWFWITKLDGKKCFLLPPIFDSYDEKCRKIPSKESRFENIIHLLPSYNDIAMPIEVPSHLLSADTTYGCYLVYKMPTDFVGNAKVKIELEDHIGRTRDSKVMPLSIPHSPVIGSDGVFKSPNQINDHKTIQLPKKRIDGWLEVNLGNTSHIRWKIVHDKLSKPRDKGNWKCWCFPCMSDNNDTYNKLPIPDKYLSDICIKLFPINQHTQTPEVFVQGIEFRPL